MSQAVSIGKEPRGQDFTHKFRKGEWAETLLLQTLNRHEELVAIQYGVSREDTLYSESALDHVKEQGVNEYKRPDILVYHKKDFKQDSNLEWDLLLQYNNANPEKRKQLLPQIEESGIISKAVMAIESEASRFNLNQRPAHYSSLSAYVKREDYPRLANWKIKFDGVPLYVGQCFFDQGYIIPFDPIEKHADRFIEDGEIDTPGFKYGSIPGIFKEGFHILVDEYPGAIQIGKLTKKPRVVKEFDGEKYDVQYKWDNTGKLIPEKEDPHFHSGKFENRAVESLATFALN